MIYSNRRKDTSITYTVELDLLTRKSVPSVGNSVAIRQRNQLVLSKALVVWKDMLKDVFKTLTLVISRLKDLERYLLCSLYVHVLFEISIISMSHFLN